MIKKNACLIVCFGMMTLCFSQKNAIVVVSATGNSFYLSINNKTINTQAQSIVKESDLDAGWHHILISTTIDKKDLTLIDSILIKPNSKFINKEITYALVNENDKLKLQFKSVSELSGPETPLVPEEPKATIPLVDNSIYGHLYQAKNNKPVFYENFNTVTKECVNTLTTKEINFALNLLIKANDEERKVKYVNQIIENNCYSVEQIQTLIVLLPIDMDKLNASKSSYTHLTDKQNAKNLLGIIKYQSMKDAYTEFLNEQSNLIKQTQLNCNTPLSDTQFDNVLSQIKNGGFENQKLLVAKKLFTTNCLSTTQVQKIAVFFSHDRETLDLFKFAYPIITDKENAKILTSEFQFSETKDEFLKFISK